MRQGTYLNAMMTVNAVLLAALVWLSMGDDGGLGPSEADAQTRYRPFSGSAPRTAAQQAQLSTDALRSIAADAEATRQLLESGRAKVQVTNIEAIQGQ